MYLKEGTYHTRLFRGPSTNGMKKWDGPSRSWPTPHATPLFLPPEESVQDLVFREGLEVLVQVLAGGAGGLEVLRSVDALDDAYKCGSGERLSECGVENSGPYNDDDVT